MATDAPTPFTVVLDELYWVQITANGAKSSMWAPARCTDIPPFDSHVAKPYAHPEHALCFDILLWPKVNNFKSWSELFVPEKLHRKVHAWSAHSKTSICMGHDEQRTKVTSKELNSGIEFAEAWVSFLSSRFRKGRDILTAGMRMSFYKTGSSLACDYNSKKLVVEVRKWRHLAHSP